MPTAQGKVALSNGYDSIAEEMKRRNSVRPERPRLGFIVLILVLALICAGLGVWQMQRLEQKEAQIARIAERAELSARPLPPLGEWVGFDPEVWDYRHTMVTGTYRPAETILVFTSLTEPRGKEHGPGYWVITPLVRAEGGTVFINRGFIPEKLKQAFADGGPVETGTQTVTGILRRPELANAFTPGTERADRIEWIRDPARFAAISAKDLAPVLPAYLDADANPEGGLPQGGETKFDLPNRHLEYAMTWFGLAGVALAMLGVWLFARRKA